MQKEPKRRGKSPHPAYVVRPPTAVLTRGYDPQLSVGSARPAVFRSSTYVFSSPESAERAFLIALGKVTPRTTENVDLIYSRLSHPNAEIVEDQIVPLEPGAESAAVFNSGMAAISTIFLTHCGPGEAFVYTTPVYGGTHHLIHQLLTGLDMVGIPVPAGETAALGKAVAEARNLRLVFVETPANPTLCMSDIRAASEAANAHPDGPLVVVDNTFLGPTFQHPLQLGADLVVYSATKFLMGFSDALGGVVLSRDKSLVSALQGTRAILGNILQPDECWILDTRLPTVTLRMNRQSKNAERIVKGLTGHPGIARLYYPTLFEDAEQKRIRDAQSSYPGSLFAMDVRGGKEAAFRFLRQVRIARGAVSLGGMETLACHPRSTTHSEMEPEDLDAAGIGEGMVRISIGIEHWQDLLADFRQALEP